MITGALIALITAVAVLAAGGIGVVAWVLRGQNHLVKADELCGNALSQIGVQQASRWDALSAIAELTKAYSQQEYATLMGTIAARQGISQQSTSAEVERQETSLQQSFGRVNALAEAYPELKSNTVYVEHMGAVRHYEDNVRMSRMVYNDTVTKYNRLVRGLPGAFLAGRLGFEPREYLQDDPATAAMPAFGN